MDKDETPKIRNTPVPATGYGLSAYYVPDRVEIGALCRTKLRRWETIAVFAIEAVLASGITVSATFRTPHVTLSHPDLDELINRLNFTPHVTEKNLYHDQ